MAITNYGTLKTALANWLDRADLVDRIPEFITLATATLNAVARHTRMVGHDSITIVQGARHGEAPASMLEPIYLSSSTDEDRPLEQVSIQQLIATRRQMTSQGHPAFFAVNGRRLEVCPTPSAQVTLELSHYQEIPPLLPTSADLDTNWVLTYRPDVYLYTALMHAAVYLKDDQKLSVMNSQIVQLIQSAVQQQATVQLDSKEAGPTLTAPRDPAKPAR